MRLSNMGQLALAVKESFATIAVDRHVEDNNIKKVTPPSTQNRYVDSVEFSDRALQLYMGAAAGMSSSEKSSIQIRDKKKILLQINKKSNLPLQE